ncbi:fructosamine kinase family protein [Hamadaea tsunoensis]|uniref:fructosamine kinase family protein n=1 Tax=Hamadaea tsunoensis TaxID=53368 RepID=UPI0004262410|nr:fructosamine kinase family protein [Hamadaea tsunoensis]
MDLAYLRAHPHLLPTFLTHQRIRQTPVGGGSISAASRLTFDNGDSVFAKEWPENSTPPQDFFAAEAAGLRWLREPGVIPVPEVLVELPNLLVIEWVQPGDPTEAGADDFGRNLARLHATGADWFGAPWPGYIGSLPMPNDPSPGPWSTWFGEQRLLPYAIRSQENGALLSADVTRVEQLTQRLSDFDAGEPPARLHGDLWPGNVLWDAGGQGWLVDPAAHGGNRITDLATLGLFGGVAYQQRVLDAYEEVHPLPSEWRAWLPCHRLHLMLVHTAIFGSGYRQAVLDELEALGF